jgi:hypothetical protein
MILAWFGSLQCKVAVTLLAGAVVVSTVVVQRADVGYGSKEGLKTYVVLRSALGFYGDAVNVTEKFLGGPRAI